MPSAYSEREKDKSPDSQKDLASVMATLATRQAENSGTRKLTGPEKAAVVLLALGEEHAARSGAARRGGDPGDLPGHGTLGTVDRRRSRTCWSSSSRACRRRRDHGLVRTDPAAAAAIMPREKVDALMEEIRGPAGRTMWDKLGNVNEAVLANYLKNEYPQTVAVVLSKIKSEHAARVLAVLPEDFALECVTRMLRMEPVQREILDKIEQTLRTEFMSNLARTCQARQPRDDGRHLQRLRPPDRDPLHHRPGRAQPRGGRAHPGPDVRLRGPLQARPGRRQTLLRAVEKDQLAWRSRARPTPARDVLLQHVERAAKIMREDMEAWARCACATSTRRRRHGPGRQGPRRQGRDHARRRRRRRRADLLMSAHDVAGQIRCSTPTSTRRARQVVAGAAPSTRAKLAERSRRCRAPQRLRRRQGRGRAARRRRRSSASPPRSPTLGRGLAGGRDAARDRGGRGGAWRSPGSSRPTLIAREPLAELAALAADCFREIEAAPRVVGARRRRTARARARRARRRPPAPPASRAPRRPGRARHRARRLPPRLGGRRRRARSAPRRGARSPKRSRATRGAAARSLHAEISWRVER